MCGIFGAFNFDRNRVAEPVILAMSNSIAHRGPDADGFLSNDRVMLGNRRLSIIDLSDASNQPFYSQDKSVVVVQNGEIYNYIELRDELKNCGIRFKTNGDTEVILRAFEFWGPNFVTRLNGMFSIAVYDSNCEKLFLYRDRLGVKPLFLAGGMQEKRLWFGSEIKAILSNGCKYGVNHDAIAQYMALNYIPQPDSIFSGIRHLPPAHMAIITANGIDIQRYWDLSDIAPEPDMTEAEGKARLVRLLDDATRLRMRADSSFGAFLSGGLDSSSVVGFMSLYAKSPVRTFSIGFSDPRFDETEYARLAAKRFGTIHVSKIVEQEITVEWPHCIWHSDQPHGDISFIPTNTVSELASKDVKMVLTGDGGDELFAGYEKYLDMFPGGQVDHLRSGWEDDVVRSSGLLHGDEPKLLLKGELYDAFFDIDPYRALSKEIMHASHQDPINRVLYAETVTLLPGNNLVKPDRMAMASSLEVRSPFLDYRMVEFAFQMPGHLKLQNGVTKSIYKAAVQPLLGDTLTYRKKQMFTVPVGEWFRQTLAEYCRKTLLRSPLGTRGLFNMEEVERMIDSHIAGTSNYTRQLRALISLEIWFQLFVDGDHEYLTNARKSL